MATEVLEQAAEERLIRRRASVEEFWSLPESVLPTEYIGGEIIMAPTPTVPHQRAVLNIAFAISQLVLRKKHYVLTELGEADTLKGAVLAGFEMKVGELLGGRIYVQGLAGRC